MDWLFVLLIIFGILGFCLYRFIIAKEREEEQRRRIMAENLARENRIKEADEHLKKIKREQELAKQKENYVINHYFDPTPDSLKKMRTKYRALYREGNATNDIEKMADALNGLYQYALKCIFCYGLDYDNSKGVLGYQYDSAVKRIYDNCEVISSFKNYSYKDYGRISGCICLSEIDWKHFEAIWGLQDSVLNFNEHFSS